MKDNYLKSLVGNVIQVYRGGPDSNEGRLLDVTDDYIAVKTEKGEIIYYQHHHIKSVRESTQVQYNTSAEEDSEYLVKAETFGELMLNFKEQTIRINGQKGPEARVGQLIDVKDDYYILYSEQDGLLFYNPEHIKSVSNIIVEDDNEEDNGSNENENSADSLEEANEKLLNHTKAYEQISADNIHGLLKNLKYSWIKINRKGPESIEGLLVEMNGDHLVIVANNEVYRIALYHVKNFSVTVKSEQQNSNDDDQQSNQNQSNQNQSNSNNNSQQSSNDNNAYRTKVERYRQQRNNNRRRRQVRQS